MANSSAHPVIQAPDGGWGWVIVACVFVLNFLSQGTMFSIGIAFDQIMTELDCTKAEVSVMASLNFSLQCFLGPIVSLLDERYGARMVVSAGVLVIAISFILSAFAPSIIYLYFSFGIFGGIGMALSYLPAVILTSFYFEKKRSLATALGGIGGYAGCFVHPYLWQFLISFYGWRGASLIIGAISLNSLAASFLLRPLSNQPVIVDSDDGQEKAQPKSLSYNRLAALVEENVTHFDPERLDSFSEDDRSIQRVNRADSSISTAKEAPSTRKVPRSRSFVVNPQKYKREISDRGGGNKFTSRFRRLSERGVSDVNSTAAVSSAEADGNIDDAIGSPPSENSSVDLNRLERYNRAISERGRLPLKLRPAVKLFERGISDDDEDGSSATVPPVIDENVEVGKGSSNRLRSYSSYISLSGIYTSRVLHSQISMEAGRSVKNVHADFVRSLSKRNLQQYAADGKEVGNEDKKDEPNKKQEHHLITAVKPIVEIFRNVEFSAFMAANFLICLVFYTPSLFIVNWGLQIGISLEKATLLLSLVGFGNIIGRPLAAFCGDVFASYRIFLYLVMVAVTGTVTAITPLFPNFYFLVLFVTQFAFLVGGSQTLLTPILADMLSLEKLGFAFGLIIAAEGAAILIGPPMLALFPTYSLTFTVAGFILVGSAVLFAAVVYTRRVFSSCRLVESVENAAKDAVTPA